LELCNLLIKRFNYCEVSFDNLAITLREREFLIGEELPSVLAEQIAVIADPSVRQRGSNTILSGGSVFDECFASPDEFPRFAELVRWNVAGSECINPEKDCEPFGVKPIAFDLLIGNQPCLVWVGDGDIKVWFETIIHEPVVACGSEQDTHLSVLEAHFSASLR